MTTYQCLRDECRCLWSAPAEPEACPECGTRAFAVYEREPERPSLTHPAAPEYVPMESPVTPAPVEAVTVTQEPAPAQGFHIPTTLKVLAGVLAPVLAVASLVVPFPFGSICAVLALLAAAFLGISIPLPKFLQGRPLVGPSLAPIFAGLSAALADFAFKVPEGGRAFYLLYLGAGVCALLAGVAVPQPGARR